MNLEFVCWKVDVAIDSDFCTLMGALAVETLEDILWF